MAIVLVIVGMMAGYAMRFNADSASLNCAAPTVVTLGGLSVSLTNIHSGYTGLALSTCSGGTRTGV